MKEPRRARLSRSDHHEYEHGSICRLRGKNDRTDDAPSAATLLECMPEDCYGHPAVLLWTERLGATVAIFIVSITHLISSRDLYFQITSFDGQPLHLKHATNKHLRMQHLPISPSPRHADLGKLLEIDGDALPKNSYVKIQQVRFCTYQDIRPWKGRKLKRDSYVLLMQYAPAKPPEADEHPVRRGSRRPRQYLGALSPNVPSRRPPSVQKLVHGRAAAYDRTIHPPDHRPPHHHMPNKPVDPLREPLLPTHRQTIVAIHAPDQRTYGTLPILDSASYSLITPSRHSRPTTNERESPEACGVFVLLLCLGLFAILAVSWVT
jgi:hypothetical protein